MNIFYIGYKFEDILYENINVLYILFGLYNKILD